ncbi:MAG: glycosyltransferase family A protein [Rhodothermales bacterium]|nr:glycosyltransferase family A protein [Rhodothermales bacterium]
MDVLILHGEERRWAAALKDQLQSHHSTLLDVTEGGAPALTKALEAISSERALLVNATQFPIRFKQSGMDLLNMVADVTSDWSMIYTDYEVDTDGILSEEHLLDHHEGRVRESTDYGLAWLINVDALRSALPLQPDVKQHMLYDLRLRLGEHGEVVHIASRYAGGTYTVSKTREGQNVFDYLLQSKESQLELESVVTSHLQRIGAYLAPGAGYAEVPFADKDYPLTASVIIPVNNRPEFIGDAIQSVWAQTVQDVEVIVVVNGGDEDPTVPVVRSYQEGGANYRDSAPAVRLIVVDINNIGYCLNSGLREARGKYYVQLDSDDQLSPDAVEKIAAVYESDPTIGMVIGSYEVWEKKEDGTIVRMESIPVVTHDEWTEENGRNNLLRINGAGAPRSFYVEVARDLGYLDMNVTPSARNYGEDYDFVLRMSEKHRIGRVWDPIYKVIRHSGGTDHSIDPATVDRNNNAKDHMRLEAIHRRKKLNEAENG